MKVKFDFTLSQRFGVVERTVFELVLRGLTSAKQISSIMWVFSDEVIASAFQKLVNLQILCADLEAQTLALSEPVQALIEKCLENSYDLEIPDNLINLMLDDRLIIDDPKTKAVIIAQLLPGIKLGFLINSLDISISVGGEGDE
ncbi:hypothetical protein [Acetivibrio mesophilus]|mgnify:CR=1 FL=1|jgi:hypothetical protein|uniref:Uncharacterized protein n=1 Tax=Acetivibrio mesophilus TaxID=2487273 RepID=A0A4Q0IBG9_9FIRM|nr:hypothetical protein [Acetivibrio mesophilus]RXE60442.1 hypothetical protein EFD62_00425 [Acetivibrio mesophilus]